MFALMTNQEIYREYLQQLRQIYNAGEAAAITDRVFERIAGLQISDIIKKPRQNLPYSVLEDLKHRLVSLLQHRPVQYVLGEAWFFKMKLTVNEQVLIPRPETEELVQLVIDDWQTGMGKQQSAIRNSEFPTSTQAPEAGRRLSILDIGTGSGCIAIALKKSLPHSIMYAIDISSGALAVAKENAVHQQVNIQFIQLDFLDEANWNALPVFDVIISNPPYIPLNEKDKLDRNVAAFEPHTALFVPDNAPLLFYEKIAAFGKRHLSSKGKIYAEIHEDFAKATMAVFEQTYSVEIKKDVFGKERMLVTAKLFRDSLKNGPGKFP